MREEHLLAMLKLDWRRLRRGFATLGLAGAAAFAFMAATGRMNAEHVIPIALGGGIAVLFAVGLLGLRDRLEGTLALFASLPIQPGRLASARLLSLGILTLPVAVTVAVVSGLAAAHVQVPLRQLAVLVVVIWVGLASAALWLAAISIAIPAQKASTTFAVLGLVAYLLLMPVERLFPDATSLIAALMSPTNAWLWPATLLTVLAASALGAWALTAWGIRNYTMEAEGPG